MEPQLVVWSQAEACKNTLPFSYIHISIRNEWEPQPVLSNDPNRVATLFLAFDDDNGDTEHSMTEEDGRKIAEFVLDNLDRCDGIAVNCMAGLSRSAGVASGIAYFFRMNDDALYENGKFPNRYCHRVTARNLEKLLGERTTP